MTHATPDWAIARLEEFIQEIPVSGMSKAPIAVKVTPACLILGI